MRKPAVRLDGGQCDKEREKKDGRRGTGGGREALCKAGRAGKVRKIFLGEAGQFRQ